MRLLKFQVIQALALYIFYCSGWFRKQNTEGEAKIFELCNLQEIQM